MLLTFRNSFLNGNVLIELKIIQNKNQLETIIVHFLEKKIESYLWKYNNTEFEI